MQSTDVSVKTEELVSDYLKCPICFQPFTEATETPCQHTFCKNCILEALNSKLACPLCRTVCRAENLKVNRLAASLITEQLQFIKTTNKKPGNLSEQIIHLSLTKTYAPKWKTRQGVRECVQNWYDGSQQKLDEENNLFQISIKVNYKEKKLPNKDGENRILKKYIAVNDKKKYGKIIYNPVSETLTLSNADVSLARKILLLGISSKTNKIHLVGQFGEGLKVGILAMLRDGKNVTMETGNEHWKFCLLQDENFEEEVLSVKITRREIQSLSTNITQTVISNLREDEWISFEKDFLFLAKPKDYVSTESGDLIVDKDYMHKLYVKNFWIADLKEDGLHMGVNLQNMELDRDRRAVVNRHDIDRRVSDIWTKAILKRSDLIPIYFDLLMEDHQMIKHSGIYISDKGVELLANHFQAIEGETAFPVCMRSGNKEEEQKNIDIIKDQFQMSPIHVPEPLYDILSRSKTVTTMENLMVRLQQTGNQKVPNEALTNEQITILNKAIAILREGLDPSIDSTKVDVWNFVNKKTLAVLNNSGRYEISLDLFDLDFVHDSYNRCTSSSLEGPKKGECSCRELRIVIALISAKVNAKPKHPTEVHVLEKLLMERLLHFFIQKTKK